jgi:transposase
MSSDIEVRLDTIENLLRELVSQRVIKDYYSTAEVATRVGRSEYQVREWCRAGRLQAAKRKTGRGRSKEWMISHEELLRYESHGLRPLAVSVTKATT